MSPDDVDSVVLKLSDRLGAAFAIDFDIDASYEILHQVVNEVLDPFVTKDRNYN